MAEPTPRATAAASPLAPLAAIAHTVAADQLARYFAGVTIPVDVRIEIAGHLCFDAAELNLDGVWSLVSGGAS